MASTQLIPNSFQHPNIYIDELSYFLTPEEEKVLNKAIREILGWHNKIESRKAYISLSVFTAGKRDKEGNLLCRGCGLSTQAVRKALHSLDKYGILCKVGEPTSDGQEFYLQDNWQVIDIAGLQARRSKWDSANEARTNKARQAVARRKGRDLPPTVPQQPPPDVAQQPPPTVGQQQRNPIETQREYIPFSATARTEYKPTVTTQLVDREDQSVVCPECEESVALATQSKKRSLCPHCNSPLFILDPDGRKIYSPPQECRQEHTPSGLGPWMGKPLKGFCAMAGHSYQALSPRKRAQWALQLKEVADEAGATIEQVYEAMHRFHDEHPWMTQIESTFNGKFKDLLYAMLLPDPKPEVLDVDASAYRRPAGTIEVGW